MSEETVYPLRIPNTLKQDLEVIATRNQRSLAWIIRDILQQYLDTRKSKTQTDRNHPYTEENDHGG